MNDRTAFRTAAAGAAAGFALGYAFVRNAQALRELRAPSAALPEPDPKRYGALRRALMVAGVVRGVASLGVTAFVLGDRLERSLAPLPRPLRAPVFALAVLAFDTVRDAGTDFVEEHGVERAYGMSNQTPAAWAADHVKGAAVTAVVTALLVALADGVVSRAPRRWPLIAIAAAPPLLAFATVAAPTFVMPLFNRYERVEGALEARIRELARQYGVGDASILHFDMSRQTKKANAFVTGVLGTQRIALADTLVENFPEDETLFVVAHELGHYVRRDPWLGIAVGTAALAAMLLAADAGLRATTRRGLDSPAQGARLAFYAALAQVVLTPAVNAVSRTMERRADRFAVDATRDAAAGARAFRRLGEQNLAELDPPRWAEVLFASHPSLASRIEALEAAAR